MVNSSKILLSIIEKKPYIIFEPFIFNRFYGDYLLYFNKYGKDKKELENVVLYKLKKDRLDQLTHVKKAYFDDRGNIRLENGIALILGKEGKTGEPIYIKDKIDKEQIQQENYMQKIFEQISINLEYRTSLSIFNDLKERGVENKFLKVFEIHRRIILSFSFLYFLIISTLLFKANLLNDTGEIIFLSFVFSIIYIFKEIFLKLLSKQFFQHSIFALYYIEILILIFSIIFIILFSKIKDKIRLL